MGKQGQLVKEMKIEETKDMDTISRILMDSGHWVDDVPELFGASWMLAKSKNGIVGCFLIQRMSVFEIRVHIAVLRKYRGIGSYYSCMAFLDWFAGECDERINKLTVEIPKIDESCIRLVKAMGLREEGVNRESVMEDGKYVDQIVLGITRREVSPCLQR